MYLPPSLERDAVRLRGLRRRADLNDHFGLVQRRLTPEMYVVRVGSESIIAKYINFVFIGDNLPPVGVDRSSEGLVLEADMRRKYGWSCGPQRSSQREELAPVASVTDVHPRIPFVQRGAHLCTRIEE